MVDEIAELPLGSGPSFHGVVDLFEDEAHVYDSGHSEPGEIPEEMAAKAPIKMLLPMTFLIFPTILIIIMGPAFLVLKESAVFSVF